MVSQETIAALQAYLRKMQRKKERIRAVYYDTAGNIYTKRAVIRQAFHLSQFQVYCLSLEFEAKQ